MVVSQQVEDLDLVETMASHRVGITRRSYPSRHAQSFPTKIKEARISACVD